MKKIHDYLKSNDGKKHLDELTAELVRKDAIKQIQLEKFHSKYDEKLFKEFVEKVLVKYRSDSYKDIWYNKGAIPPESLSFFLYDYAQEYGRECDEREYKKYSDMFTTCIYYVKGYYFKKMDGQGSIIQIISADEKDFPYVYGT